jgi:hypothetical protein
MPTASILKQLRLLVQQKDHASRQTVLERGRQILLKWFTAGARNMVNGNMRLTKPTLKWVDKHKDELTQLVDKNVDNDVKYKIILKPGGGGFLGGVIIRAILRWQQREQTKQRQGQRQQRQRRPKTKKAPKNKSKSRKKKKNKRKKTSSPVTSPINGRFVQTFQPLNRGVTTSNGKFIQPFQPLRPYKQTTASGSSNPISSIPVRFNLKHIALSKTRTLPTSPIVRTSSPTNVNTGTRASKYNLRRTKKGHQWRFINTF